MSVMENVHINFGPDMKVVTDELNGEPRWCFTCRKVREFRFIVKAPTGMSYYGPEGDIKCGTCRTSDGDLFPGRFREWE